METKAKNNLPNKVRRRKARRAAEEATKNTEARAIARYVKTAPRKLRLVVDNIRGKSTKEAVSILRFTNRGASRDLLKVLQSAIANAENNHELDTDNLYVYRAFIDGGPVTRRFRPRAMGRATPIRKKTSHITIVVREKGDES